MFSKEIINEMLEDAKIVWPDRWPVIEKYFQTCSFAIAVDNVMKLAGFFGKKEEVRTFDEMCSEFDMFEPAKYVFKKMLDILVEENVLEFKDGTYKCLDPQPDVQPAAECLVEAVREVPEEGAAFQWLARGAGGIYPFMKGKITGEEAMFGPWADFTLVGEVYYSSEVYGFWSKLAAKVGKKVISEKFNGKKITALEVGAGTGNGTTELFNSIGNPENVFERYIFTDIHKRLVKKTSKSFKDYPFMEFEGLDLTKPLDDQEIKLESIDYLYAINVMHAINDISEACKSMYDLVKKDGVVVLGEISPPKGRLYRYMELTFGLLGSYFEYDDKDLRPLSPILRPEQWIDYLKKAGFRDAVAIPGDLIDGCDRGGAVIAVK